MPDVDELIRSLRGPSPPPMAPTPPRSRAWIPAALAAAVAVAMGITVIYMGPGAQTRGAAGAAEVDLRLVVERGGVATRASTATTYAVGERAYFRIAASRDATVHLWVDSPRGLEPIARIDATPSPTDVRDAHGLVAYGFDAPGQFTFYASAEGPQVCHRCASVTLEVR